MSSLSDTLLLLLPLFLLSLLAGLGLAIAVLTSEGRAGLCRASRICAGLNLLLALLLIYLVTSAELVAVQRMFGFVALTFGVVAFMGFRFPARFED